METQVYWKCNMVENGADFQQNVTKRGADFR